MSTCKRFQANHSTVSFTKKFKSFRMKNWSKKMKISSQWTQKQNYLKSLTSLKKTSALLQFCTIIKRQLVVRAKTWPWIFLRWLEGSKLLIACTREIIRMRPWQCLARLTRVQPHQNEKIVKRQKIVKINRRLLSRCNLMLSRKNQCSQSFRKNL